MTKPLFPAVSKTRPQLTWRVNISAGLNGLRRAPPLDGSAAIGLHHSTHGYSAVLVVEDVANGEPTVAYDKEDNE